MNRFKLTTIGSAALLGLAVAPSAAPMPISGISAPSIVFSPGTSALDQRCLDLIHGNSAAMSARAAHECRKPHDPGTPMPAALRNTSAAAK